MFAFIFGLPAVVTALAISHYVRGLPRDIPNRRSRVGTWAALVGFAAQLVGFAGTGLASAARYGHQDEGLGLLFVLGVIASIVAALFWGVVGTFWGVLPMEQPAVPGDDDEER